MSAVLGDWQSLKKPCRVYVSSESILFQLNNYEFGKFYVNVLEKFNILSNEWSSVIMRKCVENVIGHDARTKMIYAIDGKSNLITLNSETGSLRVVLSDLPIKVDKGFLIGDEIHLFGKIRGEYTLARLILSKCLTESQPYDRLCRYTDKSGIGDFHLFPAFYLESRQSILCLKSRVRYGVDEGKHFSTEYSLTTKKCKIRKYTALQDSYSPSIVGCVVSADCRYLIILGGYHDDFLLNRLKFTDAIVVYDLKDRFLRPMISALRCPAKGWSSAILMTDKQREEKATFAFVHHCYMEANMNGVQHLPRYIIELIAKWVEMEYVYLLRKRDDNSHWRISVDDILESVRMKTKPDCIILD